MFSLSGIPVRRGTEGSFTMCSKERVSWFSFSPQANWKVGAAMNRSARGPCEAHERLSGHSLDVAGFKSSGFGKEYRPGCSDLAWRGWPHARLCGQERFCVSVCGNVEQAGHGAQTMCNCVMTFCQ